MRCSVVLGFVCAMACASDRRPAGPAETRPGPGATTLVGAFRGPFATAEFCGNCQTQDRFFDETTREELNVLLPMSLVKHPLVQSQARCRAIGRFVQHVGSCGEGSCRSFSVEAVERP